MVVIPNVAPPTALNCPAMVEDAETESAEVVAATKVALLKIEVPVKVGEMESTMLPVPVTALDSVTPPYVSAPLSVAVPSDAPPSALNTPATVVEPVIASEPLDVALPKSVLPASVVDAR